MKGLQRATYIGIRTSGKGLFHNRTDPVRIPSAVDGIGEKPVENGVRRGAGIVMMYHGMSEVSPRGYGSFPVSALRRHVRYLRRVEGQVWFTTLQDMIGWLLHTGQLAAGKGSAAHRYMQANPRETLTTVASGAWDHFQNNFAQ